MLSGRVVHGGGRTSPNSNARRTWWATPALMTQAAASVVQTIGVKHIVHVSTNVTTDFGNATDSEGLGVARCRLTQRASDLLDFFGPFQSRRTASLSRLPCPSQYREPTGRLRKRAEFHSGHASDHPSGYRYLRRRSEGVLLVSQWAIADL